MEPWYTKIASAISRVVLIRIIILGAVAIFGYFQVADSEKDESVRDESGEIVEAGDVGVLVLKVGDCVQLPSEFKSQLLGNTEELMTFTSFSAVPCTELHDAELYSTKTTNKNEFPGEEALFDEFSGPCVDEYSTYSGIEFDSSPHDVFPMVPTADSWLQGDREIQCFAFLVNGEQLGASIKG
jgi:hypothetical protein